MSDNEKVATLEIYNWIGMSLGAIHYYGNMSCGRKFINKIKHPISASQAITINKHVREYYAQKYWDLYSVSPGDTGDGFDTEEEVVEEAKKTWKDLFPEAEELVYYKDHSVVYDKR
jgi:hypothetical protein